MSFFHNLNKKLDGIAARPEASQLNERDEGKHNNATTGFKAVAAKAAKEYGSKAAGERVAGAVRNKMAKAGKLEEESVDEGLVDVAKKVGSMAKKAGSAVLNKVGHGDDVDMIRDLQRKMGVAQTGKKPKTTDEGAIGGAIGATLGGVGGALTGVPGGALAGTALGGGIGGAMEEDGVGEDLTGAALGTGIGALAGGGMGAAVGGHLGHIVGDVVADSNADKKQVKEKMNPAKQKSFAALAPPKDKITFADKIAGAKKEVDEMLGDVAAEAMRNALGGRQQVADEGNAFTGKLKATPKGGKFKMGNKEYTDTSGVDESYDDEDDVYAFQDPAKKKTHKTATGGTVTRHGGVTRHQAAPGHYGGFDPETDPDKDDDKPGTPAGEKRGRGRPKGAPKGPERVTAKAYKHKGGRRMSEEEIQEAIASLEECGYSVTALEEESTTKKDNRAERAGKRVTKDIEYDEKKKDGIHGKKRGAEDSKAERAGKKVAKDIEYDEKKDDGKKDEPKKSKSKFKFGGSVYEALDAQLETLITEGMGVTINMSKDSEDGHPGNKSITVNADGEDAERLAELLKMAGVSQHEETCSSCGASPCGCDMIDENNPNWPTDTETSDNAMQYSGGLNGPKSTGQSTVPVLASQLRRQVSMEESAKVEQNLLNLYRTFGK